jgi:hypothetical protein
LKRDFHLLFDSVLLETFFLQLKKELNTSTISNMLKKDFILLK